jgi:hypothetical protein
VSYKYKNAVSTGRFEIFKVTIVMSGALRADISHKARDKLTARRKAWSEAARWKADHKGGRSADGSIGGAGD